MKGRLEETFRAVALASKLSKPYSFSEEDLVVDISTGPAVDPVGKLMLTVGRGPMKHFAAGVALGIAITLLVRLSPAAPGPKVSEQSVSLSQRVIKALDDDLFTINQELQDISSNLDDIKAHCLMQ